MKIEISIADNGYAVRYIPKFPEDPDNLVVIEEDENNIYGDLESFQHLCWELETMLGIKNDKHRAKRIKISIVDAKDY